MWPRCRRPAFACHCKFPTLTPSSLAADAFGCSAPPTYVLIGSECESSNRILLGLCAHSLDDSGRLGGAAPGVRWDGTPLRFPWKSGRNRLQRQCPEATAGAYEAMTRLAVNAMAGVLESDTPMASLKACEL
jgi:hypothetical protein